MLRLVEIRKRIGYGGVGSAAATDAALYRSRTVFEKFAPHHSALENKFIHIGNAFSIH